MSKFGIEFTVGVPADIVDVEEKVDAFYVSLAECFALLNVDVAWNEDKGSLSALIAIEAPDGFEAQEFVQGVATEAVDKALRDSGLVPTDDARAFAPSTRVLEFA